MVTSGSLGAAIIKWADAEPTVTGLLLIGSQVHAGKAGAMAPDNHSDWDFHVITTDPPLFAQNIWLGKVGVGEPLAYATRMGRLGTVNKVSVVLPAGELDLVVIPARRLNLVKWLIRLGLVGSVTRAKEDLAGFAVVLRGGYRFLKGETRWGNVIRHIATEIPPLRLDDDAVRALAEGFVADYVSTRRKIARGELLAAQRWLHVHLAETNFRLAHELLQRNGKTSWPDARRIESLADVDAGKALAIEATVDARSLQAQADKAAQTFRDLMRGLLSDSWRWPELPPTPAR